MKTKKDLNIKKSDIVAGTPLFFHLWNYSNFYQQAMILKLKKM